MLRYRWGHNANYYTGMIEDGVNLPWPTPVPFAQLLRDKFNISRSYHQRRQCRRYR